jgi:drug/metabolite transporter (DMT)-like permease
MAVAQRGVLLAFATAVISGLSVYLNSFGVKLVSDAAVYTTAKNAVAAIVLVGLALALGGRREALALGARNRAGLVAIAMIGGSVPFVLFFGGLALATAPTAAFIHKTMFIWVALMAGPFLAERLGIAPILALGVLLVGQILILPPLGISWGTGETLIGLATLIWAVEVVLAKRVLGRVRSPIVGVARLGIGLIVLVGFLLATGRVAGIMALDATGWTWVAATGVLLAGYVGTWMAALRRAPATEVTSVLVLGAIITAALTAVSRGNLPDPVTSAGYALAFLAVTALVLVRRRPVPAPVIA